MLLPLKSCKQRAAHIAAEAEDTTQQKARLFHIIVEGKYHPRYWLHLEIPASEPSLIPCRKCGQPAVVCEPGYYSAWDSALCKKCAKKGSSEWSYEEMMPIVNSPRTGVCGYTG